MSMNLGVEIGFHKVSPRPIGSGSAGGTSALALFGTWAAPSAEYR